MGKYRDITGQKFGRLTVVRFSHRNGRSYYWLFRCDCGKEKVMQKNSVVYGSSHSCGCLKKEQDKKNLDNTKDITNVRFGKLLAVKGLNRKNKSGKLLWEFVCDCGSVV